MKARYGEKLPSHGRVARAGEHAQDSAAGGPDEEAQVQKRVRGHFQADEVGANSHIDGVLHQLDQDDPLCTCMRLLAFIEYSMLSRLNTWWVVM